jgi:hypothetical protein
MEFLKEFDAQFKSQNITKYSDEDRLEKLGVKSKEKIRIESLPFKSIDLDENDCENLFFEIISMSKLVGLNRSDDVSNWIECLFNLHKQRIFDFFKDRESFTKFIINCDENYEDLPHVIEHEGEYYIDGDGKHRLTIAKCLNISHIPVLVSKTKTIQEN